MSLTQLIKNTLHEGEIFRKRVIIAWLMMLLLLLVIVVRLFFLQVINYEYYKTKSNNIRITILSIPPTRGLIFDRNGVLIADNRVSFSLEVIPERVENIDLMIEKLTKIITISESERANFKEQLKHSRPFESIPLRYLLTEDAFKSIPLRYRLTEDEVARFSVKKHRFQGVELKSHLSRYYPLGATGVHAIGYVGRISEKDLKFMDESNEINKSNYKGSKYIGKVGLEAYYETELHGKTGIKKVETDVRGKIVWVLDRTDSVPGKNLYLNIDIDLQKYIEDLLGEERAAVVAIEPESGNVLALVSMPNYDPNLFVNGIDAKTYYELRDSPDRPLINRAIRGQYPPGSTVKPFVGLAGLEYGVRAPHQATWCPGFFRLKGKRHRYRDWKRGGHGSMDLHTAIEQSCDVYFYELAYDLGIDRLHSFMTRFGFGKKTGIDIPGEKGGLMPSREWKQRRHGVVWYPGETVITGIGQGFMLATPLQLAVATATLSNRGQLKQPHIVFAIDDAILNEKAIVTPTQKSTIILKHKNYWEHAIGGMKAVVHGRRGSILQGQRYDPNNIPKEHRDHAWFIAFAPLDIPRIAVSVIVENGGDGSKTAAPIAKKVMDYYLLKRAPLVSADDDNQ
ncbi:penicillin-binding protein [Candidatus Thiomargarita nelsonii]|uniref:Peptidoglycan D,D-transpeptidase MrdA n=1 Tax=Candidatus Thiomargarita nelsonii TaxID=1003181 RepID=A0A4E0QSB3_9GAMM|nr:penicillin-binding protein [Candidatus Thiomargarita nelsonii]